MPFSSHKATNWQYDHEDGIAVVNPKKTDIFDFVNCNWLRELRSTKQDSLNGRPFNHWWNKTYPPRCVRMLTGAMYQFSRYASPTMGPKYILLDNTIYRNSWQCNGKLNGLYLQKGGENVACWMENANNTDGDTLEHTYKRTSLLWHFVFNNNFMSLLFSQLGKMDDCGAVVYSTCIIPSDRRNTHYRSIVVVNELLSYFASLTKPKAYNKLKIGMDEAKIELINMVMLAMIAMVIVMWRYWAILG